jgi:hypothetical protein
LSIAPAPKHDKNQVIMSHPTALVSGNKLSTGGQAWRDG